MRSCGSCRPSAHAWRSHARRAAGAGARAAAWPPTPSSYAVRRLQSSLTRSRAGSDRAGARAGRPRPRPRRARSSPRRAPTTRRRGGSPGSRRTPIHVVAWRGRGPQSVCSQSMSRKAPPGAGMTPAKTSARRSSRAPRSVTTAVPVSSRRVEHVGVGMEESDDPAGVPGGDEVGRHRRGRPARCLRLPSRATPCHRCARAVAGPGRGPRRECRTGAPCGSSCRVPARERCSPGTGTSAHSASATSSASSTDTSPGSMTRA